MDKVKPGSGVLLPEYNTDARECDALSSFYMHTITGTPYSGYLGGYHPSVGFLFPCTHYNSNIVLVPSEGSQPDFMALDEKLDLASTLAGLVEFTLTGAEKLQANDLFYLNESGQFVKTTSKVSDKAFRSAAEIAKSGQAITKAVSVVNIGITAAKVTTQGVNVNTGTDVIVCAIGFVPGVGWIVSGIYTVANTVVTATTGKSIPEHAHGWLFEKYVRLCREVENLLFRPFYNYPFF